MRWSRQGSSDSRRSSSGPPPGGLGDPGEREVAIAVSVELADSVISVVRPSVWFWSGLPSWSPTRADSGAWPGRWRRRWVSMSSAPRGAIVSSGSDPPHSGAPPPTPAPHRPPPLAPPRAAARPHPAPPAPRPLRLGQSKKQSPTNPLDVTQLPEPPSHNSRSRAVTCHPGTGANMSTMTRDSTYAAHTWCNGPRRPGHATMAPIGHP